MPRSRSPNRDKAMQLWLTSNKKRKLKDVAEEVGVSESQIRKWKNQDQWDKVTLPITKSNVTNHRGGQFGNKNAVGNSGGAAPEGNKNAVKHGAYESIYKAFLPEDEKQIYDSLQGNDTLDDEIRLMRLKLARLIGRENIVTFDMFGSRHERELTEPEREKGIIACVSELRKLIKTKKQIELSFAKAQLEEDVIESDDGFLEALTGTAVEDWENEEN